MAEYLPPVSQKFTADISDALKKLEELKAAEKSLEDQSSKTSDSITADNEEVGKGFEDLGDKAKGAGEDVDDSFKGSGKASTDFTRLVTSNLKEGESAFESMQKAVADTKSKIVDLRSRFASTGSSSIFGDLKKSESDLKSLVGFAEQMAPGFAENLAKDGEEAGSGFATNLAGSIGDNTEIGTAVKIGLVGGVIAAAPAIIAVLNGAILTAFAGGAVAFGIYEAAKDPRISAAFKGLSSEISAELKDATSSFIGPTLAGIDDLKAEFGTIGPGLKSTFAALAPAVQPLIDGLGGFITDALPGLESGLKGAVPVLEEVATQLPWLGQQVGNMFARFSQGAPGAIRGISGLITNLGELADFIGVVVRDSSNLYLSMEQDIVHVANAAGDLLGVLGKIPGGGALKNAAANAHQFADGMQASIDAAKAAPPVLSQQTDATDALNSANKATTQSFNALVTANNAWISSAESADNTTLQFHEDLTSFDKQLKTGKDAWNINTAAGQANIAALNTVTDSLSALNPQTLASVEASKKYATQILAQAKANGATAAETKTLTGIIEGLNSEIAKLKSKTVTIKANVTYNGVGGSSKLFAEAYGGVIPAAASGLVTGGSGILAPSSPGTLVLAGERQTGGEVFAPLKGISQQRAMSLAGVLGDSYNFDVSARGSRSAMLVQSGGGSSTPITVVIPVSVGGKQLATVSRSLVATTQQAKNRGTVSGLG
jgi:hypothetical protein